MQGQWCLAQCFGGDDAGSPYNLLDRILKKQLDTHTYTRTHTLILLKWWETQVVQFPAVRSAQQEGKWQLETVEAAWHCGDARYVDCGSRHSPLHERSIAVCVCVCVCVWTGSCSAKQWISTSVQLSTSQHGPEFVYLHALFDDAHPPPPLCCRPTTTTKDNGDLTRLYLFPFLSQFDSHDPQFDQLRSVFISERIVATEFLRQSAAKKLILTANGLTFTQ